ncbi:MAG: tetratricopeptide repeat protein [Verrucomicrobia bacterium]|nr:tetratricopeptide repeat protein [Verrucomicrobiota bacterium]
MSSLQDRYDDAMYAFSQGDYDAVVAKLKAILASDATYFDAQLSLGMAYYRQGNFAAAIEEGHKAEKLKPNEQLVHTNLSLFYMRSGDKKAAEHHGLQARIASWRESSPATDAASDSPELSMARPTPAAAKPPDKFPDMPWRKKPGGIAPKISSSDSSKSAP